MTKFKEYAREKGFLLEVDFQELPTPDGIETVMVIPEKGLICTYHNCYGWMNERINRDGSIDQLWTNDDLVMCAVAREERRAERC